MTVKELMEILSKQNPDAELTVTKKIWCYDGQYHGPGQYGYFEHDTDDFDLVKITSTDKKVDFCY